MQKPIAVLTAVTMLGIAGLIVSQQAEFKIPPGRNLKGAVGDPIACPPPTPPFMIPNCVPGYVNDSCNSTTCKAQQNTGMCLQGSTGCQMASINCMNPITACKYKLYQIAPNSCSCKNAIDPAGGTAIGAGGGTVYDNMAACGAAMATISSCMPAPQVACCGANSCDMRTQANCTAAGRTPYAGKTCTDPTLIGMPGVASCKPIPPPPTGKCCGGTANTCDGSMNENMNATVTEVACRGTPPNGLIGWSPIQTCDQIRAIYNTSCPIPTGACCAGTSNPKMCTASMTKSNCEMMPGRVWHQGKTCAQSEAAPISDATCTPVCNNKVNPDPPADRFGYRGWVAKPTSYPATIDGMAVNNIAGFWAALDATSVKNAKASCATLPVDNCDPGCMADTMGGTLTDGVEVTFTPNIGPQNIPDNGNIFSMMNIGAKPAPVANFGGREVKGQCQKVRHCKSNF